MLRLILTLLGTLLLFGCDSSLRFDGDIPESVRLQMSQDLEFIQGIQGQSASPLHQKVFGPLVEGKAYVRFFAKRIQRVGRNDCSGGMACVLSFYDSHKMFISDDYINYDIPQVLRLASLIHEARHSEEKELFWPHANCPVPYVDANKNPIRGIITGKLLEGTSSCDDDVLGAYGVEVIFMANLQKRCTNCSQKTLMDAALYAADSAKRIIGQSAVTKLNQDLGFFP